MNPLYTLSGVVVKGQKRGKKLGFPTANIPLTTTIPEGIYAAKIQVKDKIYYSATFIGNAKTFSEQDSKAESYILAFSDDIYGEEVTIWLYHKIRDNQFFTSADELVKQMHKDIKAIRHFFKIMI